MDNYGIGVCFGWLENDFFVLINAQLCMGPHALLY